MSDDQGSTTRVYQYGAVPLGPFPEDGIESLFKANQLWNRLVEIHRDNQQEYEEARREADAEYGILAKQLDDVEEKIRKSRQERRNARMKARTRLSDHPAIREVDDRRQVLFDERRKLWDAIKVPRDRAKKTMDDKLIQETFNERVKVAGRVGNNPGLSADTCDEVRRNFREARVKVLKDPRSQLRFHRFDGSGYFQFRFRDKSSGAKRDGVSWSYLSSKGSDDDRSFTLAPSMARSGVPRLRLRVKVAGGAKAADKVYADFDLVLHRPIPDGAQINNAKLMRRRVGDRFKYTVNFSVRVPDVSSVASPDDDAIGIDIGFRRLSDGSIRAGYVASISGTLPAEPIVVPEAFIKRINHVRALQEKMDEAATALGNVIKPFLKGGAVLPEDHPRYRLVRAIAAAPSNVTLSLEQAYKLGSWFRSEPHTLPTAMQNHLMNWWDKNAHAYREMHNLRKKTLAYRKEMYRLLAHRLVSFRIPIGCEEIDLREFAEVRDVDNPLSDAALSQRFLVSNSELIGAIKNAANREGIPFKVVNPVNTSRTCSACGVVNVKLTSEIEWTCPDCGVLHDRDANAAMNIARRSLRKN